MVGAMTETEPILVEHDGRVVTVTFNRPDARNAMTFEMYETLHDLCERFDKDPGVRVMVLTGAGDKAFVSGTDIRQFLSFKTRDDALGYEARITRVLSRIANMTKPTIAMRNASLPSKFGPESGIDAELRLILWNNSRKASVRFPLTTSPCNVNRFRIACSKPARE